MILSKNDILRELESEDGLVIDPSPASIAQASVNLRLGRVFTTFKSLDPHFPAIRITDSLLASSDLWEDREQDHYILDPGGFVLAQTMERVRIPNHLIGFVEGRSSWARAGVSAHLTAPKIDPGFSGTITLEIANHGPAAVHLVAEQDEPAQLILFQLTEPVDDQDAYGKSPDDKFHMQDRPIPR